ADAGRDLEIDAGDGELLVVLLRETLAENRRLAHGRLSGRDRVKETRAEPGSACDFSRRACGTPARSSSKLARRTLRAGRGAVLLRELPEDERREQREQSHANVGVLKRVQDAHFLDRGARCVPASEGRQDGGARGDSEAHREL